MKEATRRLPESQTGSPGTEARAAQRSLGDTVGEQTLQNDIITVICYSPPTKDPYDMQPLNLFTIYITGM